MRLPDDLVAALPLLDDLAGAGGCLVEGRLRVRLEFLSPPGVL